MTVHERDNLSKDLLKLTAEYQMHMLGFVQAFHQRFRVDDFLGACERGKVPRTGTLDDKYKFRYRFHGVGCQF